MRRANGSRAAPWISFSAINDLEAVAYISKRCRDTTRRSISSASPCKCRVLADTTDATRPPPADHAARVLRMRTDEQIVLRPAIRRCDRAAPSDSDAPTCRRVGENRFYRKQGSGTSLTIERCVHGLREDRHAHARRPRAGSGSAALAARVEPSPKGLARCPRSGFREKMVPGNWRAGTRSPPPPSRMKRVQASPRRAAAAAGPSSPGLRQDRYRAARGTAAIRPAWLRPMRRQHRSHPQCPDGSSRPMPRRSGTEPLRDHPDG